MQTLIYNISKSRNNFIKPYGKSCFIINILKIKLKFCESSHKSPKLNYGLIGVGYLNILLFHVFLGGRGDNATCIAQRPLI